jgi:hypothetical protein
MLFDIKKDPVVRLRTISAIEKDLKRSKKGDRIAVFEMKKSTCDILGVTVGMSGSGETFVPVGGVSAERVMHMYPS